MGNIKIDNLSFAYEEGTNILEHFDLHVKPGEMIALVGPTRAGKSTVINMLTRFFDVKAGSVMVDDIDVRDATLRSLRKEVGVLMQDPFIFKGTIMDNIQYGKKGATDEECIEAAKLSGADDFISRMPTSLPRMDAMRRVPSARCWLSVSLRIGTPSIFWTLAR